MEKFIRHTGLVAPLDRDDVDTDAILPKQFMKSIARTGFGANLFDSWRYLDPGEPGMDPSTRRPNPDFVLNLPRYRGASVLLARRNFGCGSSREHAPWALREYGFRAIVAAGFADIFMQNCYKNAILPVVLDEAVIAALFTEVQAQEGLALEVDLEAQTVSAPGGASYRFAVAPFSKHCLLNGLDDIGLNLLHGDAIRAFEKERLARYPWLGAA